MAVIPFLALCAPPPASPGVEAARGVLQRTIGSQASQFDLVLTAKPRPDGLDSFTVSAQSGRVRVEATSPVSLCRGAYEYLKDACHIQVNWSGSNLVMRKTLPSYSKRTVVCPNRFRHYFNICTFGYSAVWWDWKRWQHEIDWMALHGINFPLALNGQEKVWQKVFRSYGLPDSSISKFFSGPAFLPWHWMGNLNEHGGPMPQSWIEGQAALQKKILKQERALGMTPVVSGFSGFVPVDFDKYVQGVKLASPTAWAGFAPTTFVDVTNPIFVDIGKRYVTEYKKEFGTDHYYLCDTFNEQNPQFPASTELKDLAACGKSVYESIRQADPEGTWVMQGWLFYNARDYWSVPRVNALVSEVPKGKMIVLDLATSEYPVWKNQPAVREGGWIYNTLHNYGQSTGLYGNLKYFAEHAMGDLTNPEHGKMLGMGLTMEGIDQNPVLYELMTDLMWRDEKVDVDDWVRAYAKSRYGFETDSTRSAWSYLMSAIYDQDLNWYRAAWRQRPNLAGIGKSAYDVAKLRFAVTMLASNLERAKGNPLLDRDVVDVTKSWLGVLADAHLSAACVSFDDDKKAYAEHKAAFLGLLDDIDRVMAVRPEHRLSTWVQDARAWGKTKEEKDRMEWNARMQISIWGGPVLFDYANKEWAGFTKDFLKARWEVFFAGLEKNGEPVNTAAWEEAWTRRTTPPIESKPEPLLPMVNDLLRRYGSDSGDAMKMLGNKEVDPGIAVGAKVRDSGGTERGGSPGLAVDGRLDTGYWAASPAPQWLEIDLGKECTVTGIRLNPYFGDNRYYQYKVEISRDDSTWKLAADGSGNTKVATFRGYAHKWEAQKARYVRITMLKNSANVGVHLLEAAVLGSRD